MFRMRHDPYGNRLNALLHDCKIARQNLWFWVRALKKFPIPAHEHIDLYYIGHFRQQWQEAYSALARFPVVSDWKQ